MLPRMFDCSPVSPEHDCQGVTLFLCPESHTTTEIKSFCPGIFILNSNEIVFQLFFLSLFLNYFTNITKNTKGGTLISLIT